MDPQPQTTTPWSDTQKILAIVLVSAFIIIIIIWMFTPPRNDAGATAVLNTLVGTLGGMTSMVVSFYFGSSRASNTQANTIASLVSQGPVAPPPVPNAPSSSPLPPTTPTG